MSNLANITDWDLTKIEANIEDRRVKWDEAQTKYKPAASQYKKASNRLKSAESVKACIGSHNTIMEKIIAERDQGALFILNHSGGKDSQAMYILVNELVPANQIAVVHADLGRVEWDGIKEHIRSTTEHDLHVVKAVDKDGNEKDLLNDVYKRAESLKAKGKVAPPWFSPSQRYCTSSFKTGPIEKWVRAYMKANGFTRAVNCMGIRGEESVERSENVPFELNKNLSKAGRTVYNWLPIFEMPMEGTNGVWDVIAKAGQIRHEAYDKGMSRLSCCFCVMAKKSDIQTAAKLKPELFAEYVQAEKDLGYTMFSGKGMEEMAGVTVAEIKKIA